MQNETVQIKDNTKYPPKPSAVKLKLKILHELFLADEW